MKVFISWSGEFSKNIAIELKDWLEQCIQSVEAFVSSEDIEKGDSWSSRLSTELSDSNYGIVCLTSENVSAPWIHFEAGALSKLVDSRVSAIATDIQVADIKGPLSRFQNTKLDKQDMLKLLQSINDSIGNCGEKQLSPEKLKSTFNAFWDSFDKKIKNIIEEHGRLPIKKSSSKLQINSDSIDELLQLIRNQSAILSELSKNMPLNYMPLENRNVEIAVERITDIVYDYSFELIMLAKDNINSGNKNSSIQQLKFTYRLLQDISKFVEKFNMKIRMKFRRHLKEIEYILNDFDGREYA